MATTKIASEVFKIDSPVGDVYALLSDFNRLSRLLDFARQMGITKTPELAKATEKIESVRFSEEACCVVMEEIGEVVVKIVEKEEAKFIKLGGNNPIDFNLWIQLLENGPYDTRVKLTFQGELPMMMKMVLKGKLEKGINQLGEGLTKIPYAMLKV